jgi:hypothetical protein
VHHTAAPEPYPQPSRPSPTVALPYDFPLRELDLEGLRLAWPTKQPMRRGALTPPMPLTSQPSKAGLGSEIIILKIAVDIHIIPSHHVSATKE